MKNSYKQIIKIITIIILASILLNIFTKKDALGANITLNTETAANSYAADTGNDKKWQGTCIAGKYVVVCAFSDHDKNIGNIYVFDKNGNQKCKVNNKTNHHCNSVTYDSKRDIVIIAAKTKEPIAYKLNQSTGKLTETTINFKQKETVNGENINPTAIAYNPIADNFVALYSYASKYYVYSSTDFYNNTRSTRVYSCVSYNKKYNCQQATAKNNFLYYLVHNTENKVNYIYVYDLLDNGKLVDTIEETNSKLEMQGLSFDATSKFLYVSWYNHTGEKYKKYAVYKSNLKSTDFYRYSATFNGNGGSNAGSIQKYYKEAIGTLPTSSRNGYTFQGWFTSASGGTTIVSSTKLSADTTYYAHWAINTYSIQYNLNGGIATGSNPSSYTVQSGNIQLSNPTRTGYSFKGWTGSNGSNPQTIVNIPSGSTGNKSYTANWVQNKYYFDVNPSSGIQSFDISIGGVSKTGQTDYFVQHDYGTQAIITNIKAKPGYTYTGYTNSGSLTNVAGSNNTTIKVQLGEGNGAIALNSVTDGYSITYDLNGGSVAKANPTSYRVDSADITLNNPVKEGYTFKGWIGTGLSSASTSVKIPKGSSGNRQYTAVWKDETAPKIVLEKSEDKTYTQNKNITVTLSDLGSGLASGGNIEYGWSKTTTDEPLNYTKVSLNYSSGSKTVSFIASGSGITGQYYLWIKVITLKDIDGNNATSVRTTGSYCFDNVVPIIGEVKIINEDGSNYEPNVWKKCNVRIELNKATDEGGSGVKSMVYTIGNQSGNVGESKIIDLTESGNYNINLTAKDNAGNTTSKTYNVKIDKTAPVPGKLTLTKENGKIYTSGKWTNNNVKIKLDSGSDSLSGHASTRCIVSDQNEELSYINYSDEATNTMLLDKSGIYQITVVTTDLVGNTAEDKYEVKIDKEITDSALLIMTKEDGKQYNEKTWTNQNVTIEVENFSDGVTSSYTINGGNEIDGSTSSTLSESGIYHIEVITKDNDENEVTNIYEIKIDKEKPVAGTLTMKLGSKDGENYINDTWTNKDVYIELNEGSDKLSKQSTRYKINDGGYQIKSRILNESKFYNIEVITRDEAGNEEYNYYKIKIDKENPLPGILTMKLDSKDGEEYKNNTWTNHDVYIEPNEGVDEGSGDVSVKYIVNGEQEKTDSQILSESGVYQVEVIATDKTENTSRNTYTIKIDKTVPKISLNTNENTTYTRNKDISLLLEDKESNLDNIKILCGWSKSNIIEPENYDKYKATLNGNETYTLNIENLGEGLTGEYYLWIRPELYDKAENCNSETIISTGKFYFDNTIPIIMLNKSEDTEYTKTKDVTLMIENNGVKLESAKIQYGWSRSKTIEPENYSIYETKFENNEDYTINIKNIGEELTGEYYLWVNAEITNISGKSDIISIKSTGQFFFDNEAPIILMENSNDTEYVNVKDISIGIMDNESKLSYVKIEYGWSQSNTIEPEKYETYQVKLDRLRILYISLNNFGNDLNGEYYLWIKPKLLDRIGNINDKKLVSTKKFKFNNPKTQENNENLLENEMASERYKIQDNDIYINLEIDEKNDGISINELKKDIIIEKSYRILDKYKNELKDTDIIKTGDKIEIETGEEYVVIVKDDINGDGKFDLLDIAKMKMHIEKVEGKELKDEYVKAGDTDDNGKIDVDDLEIEKQAFLEM